MAKKVFDRLSLATRKYNIALILENAREQILNKGGHIVSESKWETEERRLFVISNRDIDDTATIITHHADKIMFMLNGFLYKFEASLYYYCEEDHCYPQYYIKTPIKDLEFIRSCYDRFSEEKQNWLPEAAVFRILNHEEIESAAGRLICILESSDRTQVWEQAARPQPKNIAGILA